MKNFALGLIISLSASTGFARQIECQNDSVSVVAELCENKMVTITCDRGEKEFPIFDQDVNADGIGAVVFNTGTLVVTGLRDNVLSGELVVQGKSVVAMTCTYSN